MKQRPVGKRSPIFSAAVICLMLLAMLLSSSQIVSGAPISPERTQFNQTLPQGFGALAPPSGITAVDMDQTVILTWNKVTGANAFKVYRSVTQGMNYVLVNSVPANPYSPTFSYKDEGLVNQQIYYYVVTAITGDGVESSYSNEVAAMPHLMITWAGHIYPDKVIAYQLGAPDPLSITGRFFIGYHTGPEGPAEGIIGQFGYGPAGTAPNSWTQWLPATYAGKPTDESPVANDLYRVVFRPEAAGDYNYVFRFSSTLGRDWIYGGVTVPINPALPLDPTTNKFGILNVTSTGDVSVPSQPGALSHISRTTREITMGWTASTDNAMYRYDIFRATAAGGPYTLAGSVDAAADPLEFTDTGLISGTNYFYVVQAVDTSFNRSAFSNELADNTLANLVTVVVRVKVPEFSPAGDTIYISRSANADGTPSAESWTAMPLTPSGQPNTYQASLTLREGTLFSFNVSRGSQASMQTNADGNTAAPAPDFVVKAGETLIERTVLNWDDPIVIRHWPDQALVKMKAPISVTWSQAMPDTTGFIVTDITNAPVAVQGMFKYNEATHTTAFVPVGSIIAGHSYNIVVSDQLDMKGTAQIQLHSFTFQADKYTVTLSIVNR